MSPEEALRKANAAQRIFEDPIVKESFEVIERDVMEAWLACPVRDVEGREHLWRMAVTARKFRDLLRGTMESGKLALDQIKRKESLTQRAVSAIRRM